MLATAIEILDATKNSIFDEDIMGMAGELHTRRNEEMSDLIATIDEMDNLSETILEEDNNGE